MAHWHVVVEGPGELHGRRSYPVASLARAETEREHEKWGQTTGAGRQVTITNCDQPCLGEPSPPKVTS